MTNTLRTHIKSETDMAHLQKWVMYRIYLSSLTSLTGMCACSLPYKKNYPPHKGWSLYRRQSSIIQLEGSGGMPQWLRTMAAFQEVLVQFPTPTCNSQHPHDGSQLYIYLEVSSTRIQTWATPSIHSCLLLSESFLGMARSSSPPTHLE